MFSLKAMASEFKGLKAVTVWPSAYLSPSAAEQQPTMLQRPQGLKRQLWPIYGRLTFFPSRLCYSFPTHLSFPFKSRTSHQPLSTSLPLHNDFSVSLLLLPSSPSVSHTAALWFALIVQALTMNCVCTNTLILTRSADTSCVKFAL